MHLYYDNINDAFTGICNGFAHNGDFKSETRDGNCYRTESIDLIREPSRYGDVVTIPEPVIITYRNPLKRVLFHPIRDCNPFFHLIESLWMLAGCSDVTPLLHFNKRMAEFVDKDTEPTMWGAYGARWRRWNQLHRVIDILNTRQTRRAVLQMWDAVDLQRVYQKPDCKDVPCNLLVMFRPQGDGPGDTSGSGAATSPKEQTLDMTVINRSNDTLWGALGSNYVTFSMLHEYVATSAGYQVGHYHQVSNNLHVYEQHATATSTTCGTLTTTWSNKWGPVSLCREFTHPYVHGYNHYPLFVSNGEQFDKDCQYLFTPSYDCLLSPSSKCTAFFSTFFQEVIGPMLLAWEAHKAKDQKHALHHAVQIVPLDWRANCADWLKRRYAH